jgi:hypothetical protein
MGSGLGNTFHVGNMEYKGSLASKELKETLDKYFLAVTLKRL